MPPVLNEKYNWILKESNINSQNLAADSENYLNAFNEFGLLKRNIFQLNKYAPKLVSSAIEKNRNYFNILKYLIFLIENEFQISRAIAFEFFSPKGDAKLKLFDDDGFSNQSIIEDLVENKHRSLPSLFIYLIGGFDDSQSFESDLVNYCGVNEDIIEELHRTDFLEFSRLIFFISQEKGSGISLYAFLKIMMGLPLQFENLKNEDDFNTIISNNEKVFFEAVKSLCNKFNFFRKFTESIIETYFLPIILQQNVILNGDSNILPTVFEQFNITFSELFFADKFSLDKSSEDRIENYLSKNYDDLRGKAGFLGLASRQDELTSNLRKLKTDRPAIESVSNEELLLKIPVYQKTLDEISIIHRFKFILDNLGLLNSVEEPIVLKKISEIVSSQSHNFYSDIFELYFYFLMKRSGLDIYFLKSQMSGSSEISTCDYKLGSKAAADSKCLTGEKITLTSVAGYYDKIGKQIDSTIGYENVEFGGCIIGLRDVDSQLLVPFRHYNPERNDTIIERARIFKVLIQLYSEQRKDLSEKAKNIKFLLLYYLPTAKLTIKSIREATIDTKTDDKEVMILFTTKYATESEIDVLKLLFQPVCPMLFKFNTILNE